MLNLESVRWVPVDGRHPEQKPVRNLPTRKQLELHHPLVEIVANDVTFSGAGGTLQITSGFAATSGKVFNFGGPGTIQVDSGTFSITSAIDDSGGVAVSTSGLIKTGAFAPQPMRNSPGLIGQPSSRV